VALRLFARAEADPNPESGHSFEWRVVAQDWRGATGLRCYEWQESLSKEDHCRDRHDCHHEGSDHIFMRLQPAFLLAYMIGDST
jgi:hypothetical protein